MAKGKNKNKQETTYDAPVSVEMTESENAKLKKKKKKSPQMPEDVSMTQPYSQITNHLKRKRKKCRETDPDNLDCGDVKRSKLGDTDSEANTKKMKNKRTFSLSLPEFDISVVQSTYTEKNTQEVDEKNVVFSTDISVLPVQKRKKEQKKKHCKDDSFADEATCFQNTLPSDGTTHKSYISETNCSKMLENSCKKHKSKKKKKCPQENDECSIVNDDPNTSEMATADTDISQKMDDTNSSEICEQNRKKKKFKKKEPNACNGSTGDETNFQEISDKMLKKKKRRREKKSTKEIALQDSSDNDVENTKAQQDEPILIIEATGETSSFTDSFESEPAKLMRADRNRPQLLSLLSEKLKKSKIKKSTKKEQSGESDSILNSPKTKSQIDKRSIGDQVSVPCVLKEQKRKKRYNGILDPIMVISEEGGNKTDNDADSLSKTDSRKSKNNIGQEARVSGKRKDTCRNLDSSNIRDDESSHEKEITNNDISEFKNQKYRKQVKRNEKCKQHDDNACTDKWRKKAVNILSEQPQVSQKDAVMQESPSRLENIPSINPQSTDYVQSDEFGTKKQKKKNKQQKELLEETPELEKKNNHDVFDQGSMGYNHGESSQSQNLTLCLSDTTEESSQSRNPTHLLDNTGESSQSQDTSPNLYNAESEFTLSKFECSQYVYLTSESENDKSASESADGQIVTAGRDTQTVKCEILNPSARISEYMLVFSK